MNESEQLSGNKASVQYGGSSVSAGGPVTPARNSDATARKLTEAVRSELGHVMVAVTAIRNEVAAIGGTLRRLEERMERLERGPAEALGRGNQMAVRDSSDAGLALMGLEKRILDVNDRTAQDILDAILAVAQHLEAVQTATSWTLMQELRTD